MRILATTTCIILLEAIQPKMNTLHQVKAYECPVKVTADGKLEIPDYLIDLLPPGEIVRLLILVDEHSNEHTASAWSRATAEQFFSGYDDSDSMYDSLEKP